MTEENEYHDENLDEPYIWKKKFTKSQNLSDEQINAITKKNIQDMKYELVKSKMRFMERNREKQFLEEQKVSQQNILDDQYYTEWSKHVDKFNLEQESLRSSIRFSQGRAKTIDKFKFYFENKVSDGFCPVTYVESCIDYNDLNELCVDIEAIINFEKNKLTENGILKIPHSEFQKNNEFWFNLKLICSKQLNVLQKINSLETHTMIRRTGIHSSVEDEVSKIFEGKSLNALEMLREQIIQKLDSQAKIDRAYWERLLQKLKENVARQKLCQIHSLILSINATKIKVESLPISRNMKEKFDQYEAYKNGRYSPALIDFDSVPQVAKVVSETYDKKVIDSERSKIFEKFKNVVKSEEIYERMLQEAREGMNEHEMEFKDTVNIESNSSMTLKKPRFFNRINAGFDWNKYNQAHYDVDNPPPKVVLGYKFSIFYPDLLDPSKTPSYTLKPYPVDKDFSILTFNASAPYEDIAFKIVNREWETSSKYGFRGKFQDGIFQLWFHFKRYRYRR